MMRFDTDLFQQMMNYSEKLIKETVAQTVKEMKEKKPEFMTVKEVAHELNLTARTVRDKIKKGQIKALKLDEGMYQINRDHFHQKLQEYKSLKFKRNL
mgnify:CR=1 FL=1